MKRSLQVATPLLTSAGLALLAGCHHPEPKRCVDENNRIVDQSFCLAAPPGPNGATINNHYYGPGLWPYHFYYGGGGGWAPGALVSGGSATPLSGHSYSTSSTTRGGFGSSFGGGSGEGGGGHGGE